MTGAPIPSVSCECLDCSEMTNIGTGGLCLSDGTPILVIVTRDTDGNVTEEGWINLATGTYTTGVIPAGTTACGDAYDFALSGWLCDVLGDGSVAGIAMVQIERDETGAVIDITLVGVDGLTYTPTGTMMKCPEDRLYANILCDTGNANTKFIRFFAYSVSGSIPYRDTDLEGDAYVAIGPVEVCDVTVVGAVADSAADGGEFPVKVGGVYNTIPPVYADGDVADRQVDYNGYGIETLGTTIAGEDQTNNRMMVEHQYLYSRKTADGAVKSAAGFVHSITLTPTTATPTAGLITLYDNTAESGTIIFSKWFYATDAGATFILDVVCTTGIYVSYDATVTNMSVEVSYR